MASASGPGAAGAVGVADTGPDAVVEADSDGRGELCAGGEAAVDPDRGAASGADAVADTGPGRDAAIALGSVERPAPDAAPVGVIGPDMPAR